MDEVERAARADTDDALSPKAPRTGNPRIANSRTPRPGAARGAAGLPAPARRGGPGAREKLRLRGPAAMTEAELFALILGSGTAGASVHRIGRVLARHGTARLAAWTPARWREVRGVGPARAAALAATFEIARRLSERPVESRPIRGPEDVLAHVRDLTRARREHFVVLLLNARHELQCRETVSIGSLNASIVHPREVFLPAILHSAASLILVHNHPSGDPEPSQEDLDITRRLAQVGDLVGIGVLDHVIVAARGIVSLKSRRLL